MAGREAHIDWSDLERLYRENRQSVNSLARDFGVSEAAIRKRATRRRWVRDETESTRRAAYEEANRRVAVYVATSPERLQELAVTGADVLGRHRKDTALLRASLSSMADELIALQDTRPELEERLIEYFEVKAAGSPLMASRYRHQLQQALASLSLHSRSKILLNIVNALTKLVDTERAAWGLNERTEERSYEDVLAEVYAKGMSDRAKQGQARIARNLVPRAAFRIPSGG